MVHGVSPTDASASSIHSQLYKARGRGSGPDAVEGGIEAIVHVHGPYGKAFSSLGRELDMISQDACAYAGEQVLVPFGGMFLSFLAGASACKAALVKREMAVHGASKVTLSTRTRV